MIGCPLFEWCENSQFSLPGSPVQLWRGIRSGIPAVPYFHLHERNEQNQINLQAFSMIKSDERLLPTNLGAVIEVER